MNIKLSKITKLFWVSLELIPIIVPTFIAAFGAVAVLFLLLDNFDPRYIWSLGLLSGVLSSYTIVKHYPEVDITNRPRKICNLLMVFLVLVWGLVNVFYTSQHLLTNRDPALYVNAGIWLTEHDNLKIDKVTTFEGIEGVYNDGGAGFGSPKDQESGHYYAQGLHLLPAFFGLTARVTSISHALHINVLFGMSALFAIYAFGRIIIKRTLWAVVGTAVMAVSMPLIYFSRDMYSEPLAVTFTFGGLALIWLALEAKKPSLWFLAGFVVGAGVLTRIDGYVSIIAVLAFLGVMTAFSAKKDRLISIKNSIIMSMGMLATALLGWLDLSQLSAHYYRHLSSQFSTLVIGIVAILIISTLLVLVTWKTSLIERLDIGTKKWRAQAAALSIPLLALVLITRPIWRYGNFDMMDVAPDRLSYAEITTWWISWYIGETLAVLGVAGIAYLVYKTFKKYDLFVVASLMLVLSTTLLYLVKPNIYPDQIWASRRLLPVAMPGIAIFGAYAASLLCGRLKSVKWLNTYTVLAGLALIATPLITSGPLIPERTFMQLGTVEELCDGLPENAAIMWVGTARITLTQPTRGLCGAPGFGVGPITGATNEEASPSMSMLIQFYERATQDGVVPVVGVLGSDVRFLPEYANQHMTTVSLLKYKHLERKNDSVPRQTITVIDTIELATVDKDGALKKL